MPSRALLSEVQSRGDPNAVDAVGARAWGWTLAGGWDSLPNRRLGVAGLPQVTHRWALDTETMTGTNQHRALGHAAPIYGRDGDAAGRTGKAADRPAPCDGR